MSTKGFTIAINDNGRIYEITKLVFGRDGSYMVMVPYHSANKGFLFKMSIPHIPNDKQVFIQHSEFIIDSGTIEDKRIKLSHHRDGFVQFSGEGVTSGTDKNRKPKGIGIYSWSLDKPAFGPSFIIAFYGLDDFKHDTPNEPIVLNQNDIVFELEELSPSLGSGFVLEGFYFPPTARRFVKSYGNNHVLQIKHPTGLIMDLTVAISDPKTCNYPGIIGLHLYRSNVNIEGQTSGYIMSSATEFVPSKKKGRYSEVGIFCIFPAEMISLAGRDLNFNP
jgi:hypothetical protein